MSHATNTPGVTTHPDAPRASEQATTASTKEAAAQGLVRGEDVRTAAAKALVHTAARPGAIALGTSGSDTTDDAGTTLATDTVASARGAATLSRRLRHLRHRRTKGTNTGNTEDDTVDDTYASNGSGNRTDTGADNGGPAGDAGADESPTASAPTDGNAQNGTTRPASRVSPASHTSHDSSAALATVPEIATPSDPSMPATASPSRRRSGALDVTPRPTVGTDAREPTATSTTVTDTPVHAGQGAHDRLDHRNHQGLNPVAPSHRQPRLATNGSRNVTPKAAGARTVPATNPNGTNRTLWANRRRTIERRCAAAMARRSPVTGISIATTSTTSGTSSATPATMAVAAPILCCALTLWAIFMVLMTLLVGGAADEVRLMGAQRVADVATEAYETGANRGDYHWKGQPFRDYVGGTTGAWDAAFCSWCLGQAGFVDSRLVGRYASVDSFVARFEFDADVGEVHGPGDLSYTPAVGDLLVLWAGTDAARIEVVTAVTADGRYVTTVSGDAAGGEAGSYDRDADGQGGYVAATERAAHASGTTYLHPHYATDSMTSSP